MSSSRIALCAVLALGLAGCGGSGLASRSGADMVPPFSGSPAPIASAASYAPLYQVAGVSVSVPRSLTVSEAHGYYPRADIVWRGDPPGDRHAQVQALVEDAFAAGAQGLAYGPPVLVDVQITRFHALTEKARYSVGGAYGIRFVLTLRDAATGAVIDGPRPVRADARASGGARALAEEQRGETQRVVITRHLANVLRRELSVTPTPPQAAAEPAASPAPAL